MPAGAAGRAHPTPGPDAGLPVSTAGPAGTRAESGHGSASTGSSSQPNATDTAAVALLARRPRRSTARLWIRRTSNQRSAALLLPAPHNVANSVGGTLVNLAARAVAAQVTLPPELRQALTIAVDEFHTIPGADYEQVFGELSKYGANMILATQTLARLDRLTDAQRTRDLRAAVFSNLDGLFAFHTSAEDAAYLVDELGGGLDAQDLLELGHYQCYARLTDARTGERLPSFSVQLDPPPHGDEAVARRLAEASARRYGRDAVDIDLDLQAARARIDGPRRSWAEANDRDDDPSPPTQGQGDNGLPAADRTVTGGEIPTPNPPRAKKPRTRSSVRAKGRRKGPRPDPSTGGEGLAADSDTQEGREL